MKVGGSCWWHTDTLRPEQRRARHPLLLPQQGQEGLQYGQDRVRLRRVGGRLSLAPRDRLRPYFVGERLVVAHAQGA